MTVEDLIKILHVYDKDSIVQIAVYNDFEVKNYTDIDIDNKYDYSDALCFTINEKENHFKGNDKKCTCKGFYKPFDCPIHGGKK